MVTYTRIDHRPNYKTYKHKISGRKPLRYWVRQSFFLDMTPKILFIKEKNFDKFDILKIKY